MTDILLQPTGNPSLYEVIANEHIVGRIALFSALRDRSKPWKVANGVWLRGVARRRHAGIRPLLVPGKQNVKPGRRLRRLPDSSRFRPARVGP